MTITKVLKKYIVKKKARTALVCYVDGVALSNAVACVTGGKKVYRVTASSYLHVGFHFRVFDIEPSKILRTDIKVDGQIEI